MRILSIGLKIKTLRNEFNLTQSEFANTIGITRSNLSQLEIGKSKPTFDILLKIVTELKIDANLFFQDDKNVPQNVQHNVPYSQNSQQLSHKRSVGETCLKSSDLSPPNEELYTELKQQVKDKDSIIAAQKGQIAALEMVVNLLEVKAQAQDNSEERKTG